MVILEYDVTRNGKTILYNKCNFNLIYVLNKINLIYNESNETIL